MAPVVSPNRGAGDCDFSSHFSLFVLQVDRYSLPPVTNGARNRDPNQRRPRRPFVCRALSQIVSAIPGLLLAIGWTAEDGTSPEMPSSCNVFWHGDFQLVRSLIASAPILAVDGDGTATFLANNAVVLI